MRRVSFTCPGMYCSLKAGFHGCSFRPSVSGLVQAVFGMNGDEEGRLPRSGLGLSGALQGGGAQSADGYNTYRRAIVYISKTNYLIDDAALVLSVVGSHTAGISDWSYNAFMQTDYTSYVGTLELKLLAPLSRLLLKANNELLQCVSRDAAQGKPTHTDELKGFSGLVLLRPLLK